MLLQKLGLIFVCIGKRMMLRPCGYCCNVVCALPCRMTAVRPSESSPDGAQAAAGTADSGGSGAASTAAEPRPDARGAPGGGASAAIAGVQRFNRWSHQDSSDINTDDEGTSLRRLTPLERLNLDMCQDERCEGAALVGTADLW